MVATTVNGQGQHTLPNCVLGDCVIFTTGQLRRSSGQENCAVTQQTLDLIRNFTRNCPAGGVPKFLLKNIVQSFGFDQCITPDGVRATIPDEAVRAIQEAAVSHMVVE